VIAAVVLVLVTDARPLTLRYQRTGAAMPDSVNVTAYEYRNATVKPVEAPATTTLPEVGAIERDAGSV
jgi:hypothetical protein